MKRILILLFAVSFANTSFAQNGLEVPNAERDAQSKKIISKIRFSNFTLEREEEMRELLIRLGRIQANGSTRLYKEKFPLLAGASGALDGLRLLKYITSYVREIKEAKCANPNAAACTIEGSGVVLVTDYIGIAGLRSDWIGSAMTFIHEAGHHEFPGPHTQCGTARRDCDLGTDSAYGLQAVVLANIAKYCLNCTKDEIKMAAIISYELAIHNLSPRPSANILRDMPECEQGESKLNLKIRDIVACRIN